MPSLLTLLSDSVVSLGFLQTPTVNQQFARAAHRIVSSIYYYQLILKDIITGADEEPVEEIRRGLAGH